MYSFLLNSVEFLKRCFSLLNQKSLKRCFSHLVITLGDLAQMRMPQGRCRTPGSEGEFLITLLCFWHLEWIHDFTWWKGKERSISQEGGGNRKYFKIALKMWLRYDSEKKEFSDTWQKETKSQALVHQAILLSAKNGEDQPAPMWF